ncbi:FadR/GntR family transcriptional regulator [Aminobacter sp. Piv2-1]|uniref:FadR/GntR family transcriptional regulator n=1 Tax=Aminobacter sp. Piv2-1 TaxID=3031122 RepID=UPI00309B431C
MKINTLDRPVRLPARIADALMKEISDGRLQPGDRLPTEQYLAENFGVSRNVVREAIAQLRSAGVVHSRQGHGTVVAEPEKPFHIEFDQGTQGGQFQNVYELRMGIEMQAAALAALRGGEDQLAAISATLERMEEAERWQAEGVDLDIEFHLAVAAASGNPLIGEAITFLTSRMRETIVATRERSGEVVGEVKRLTIDEHRAIRDAIVARNPAAAKRAVAAHITRAAHRLGYDLPEESAGLDS